jgi:hypothetical protein
MNQLNQGYSQHFSSFARNHSLDAMKVVLEILYAMHLIILTENDYTKLSSQLPSTKQLLILL